jgi:hypothetical protein
MSFINKLKARWRVESSFQVVVILVVFACTGFSVMFLKKPLYTLVGIDEYTPAWIRISFYSLTILPAYQVILLMYGFVFGQFKFFLEFERRMFKGIGKLFQKIVKIKK